MATVRATLHNGIRAHRLQSASDEVLAGQPADAVAVLEHEHPIAVETANHRSRRAGAKTAFGDAEFAVERLAE